MIFQPVIPNPDLDIHPEPGAVWGRVAVVCLWADQQESRKDWPHAAVVAPLRTVRGVDELARNLLANPQIRHVVVTGPDRSVGEQTTAALTETFAGETLDFLGADLHEPFTGSILGDVVLWFDRGGGEVEVHEAITRMFTCDRPTPSYHLPPPPPEPTAGVPLGDPGDRIAGSTVADVYARALRHILTVGEERGSQYGATREVLNLVTVVRDPVASLGEWDRRCETLGATEAELGHYAKTNWGEEIPAGASYGYGARMAGIVEATQSGPKKERSPDELVSFLLSTSSYPAPIPMEDVVGPSHQDQLQATIDLLAREPSTRSAYVSCWYPDDDTGKERGRPCLTGLHFYTTADGARAGDWMVQPDPWRVGLLAKLKDGSLGMPRPVVLSTEVQNLEEARAAAARLYPDGRDLGALKPPALHLTVTFRSHDLFGGYALNLGALCRLLVETLATLKTRGWDERVQVGSITCLSMSAHVYTRDLVAAEKVVAGYRRKGLRMDPRSTWSVRWVLTNEVWMLRAVALTPDGADVLMSFEGRTGGALRAKIEESGLIQEVGNALWLGGEIERVERDKPREAVPAVCVSCEEGDETDVIDPKTGLCDMCGRRIAAQQKLGLI